MAQEKNEISNSFWSISRSWNLHKLFSLFPNSSKSFGFSLIEVLVVIAVIGVMAGTLVVIINPVAQMQKARDSRTISNAKEIQTALELYRADCGSYPGNISSGSAISGNCNGSSITYLKIVPAPGTGSWSYADDGSGGYTLSACLEYKDTKGEDVAADTNCTSGKAVEVESP